MRECNKICDVYSFTRLYADNLEMNGVPEIVEYMIVSIRSLHCSVQESVSLSKISLKKTVFQDDKVILQSSAFLFVGRWYRSAVINSLFERNTFLHSEISAIYDECTKSKLLRFTFFEKPNFHGAASKMKTKWVVHTFM